MVRKTIIFTAIAGCAAVAAPAGALAASTDRPTTTGKHHLCAASSYVRHHSTSGVFGLLTRGTTFKVRRYSLSGENAYGYAYGHVKDTGWVKSDDLCKDEAGGTAGADGPPLGKVKIQKKFVYVRKHPANTIIGQLTAGTTFKVSRYSTSGKYAYGYAFGHVRHTGWVKSGDLRP